MKRLILVLAILATAGCSTLGTIVPGIDTPEFQADEATLVADIAEFKADLAVAKQENLPGIEELVADIAAKDYPGAVVDLLTVIPALKGSAPELIDDAKTIVADLKRLVKDATGKKAVVKAQRAVRAAKGK